EPGGSGPADPDARGPHLHLPHRRRAPSRGHPSTAIRRGRARCRAGGRRPHAALHLGDRGGDSRRSGSVAVDSQSVAHAAAGAALAWRLIRWALALGLLALSAPAAQALDVLAAQYRAAAAAGAVGSE